MDRNELLRKLGDNINPAPPRDPFGRKPATPLEIQDAMQGRQQSFRRKSCLSKEKQEKIANKSCFPVK